MTPLGKFLVVGVLAGALTACGGCDTPTGSCLSLELGTVRVLVQDQEGAPVPNVRACASSPQNVCFFTRTNGVAQFPITAGVKRISIEAPEGYVQGSDPLDQLVEVVRGQSIQVDFRLVRQ